LPIAKYKLRFNWESQVCVSGKSGSYLQVAAGGDDWEAKAASKLPFGRLVAPEEAARAVNFLVSADSGMMTGAIVNFHQSVWGAVPSVMPTPTAPMTLE
jgi:NAD(P)-dependent dehydrogenase (short-subunit alcohol dehydrogenase family)